MPVPPRIVVVVLLLPLISPSWSHSVRRRADIPSDGFFVPTAMGGNMLTSGFPTFPPGLGEPLNTIIAAGSDAAILKDQQVDGGLRNYFLSLSFSSECLGQHLGSDQLANLGDGHGAKNETAVMRYNYGDPSLGSCKESVQGGNHFRYWVQDGPDAKSGAIFMAMSAEKPIKEGHDIIFNGYNLARDWLVGNITQSTIPTANLTNTSTYTGTTESDGYKYQTDVKYMSGMLQNTNEGVNHFLSVGGGPNNINATDGLVAVLTVKITGVPDNNNSAALRVLALPRIWGFPDLAIITLFLTFGPWLL